MKRSILTFIGLAIATLTLLAADGNHQLTVVVKNIPSDEGTLRVTLFDSEENWLTEGELKTVPIDNANAVSIVFENLPKGVYGVAVIHDENSNEEMDKGTFGIPTEAYGFSNNARGMFGPAEFEESKFELTQNKTIEINIE